MRTRLFLCLLTLPVFAQDAPPVEVLAQGPLGSICVGGPADGFCPFPEQSMGWFIHVRSEDMAVVGFTALLKYTDKDGAEKEAMETVALNRELSDTAFIALRVGPFKEGSNTFKSIEVKPLTVLPPAVE